MSDAHINSKRWLRPTIRVFYWSAAWGLSILLACIGAKFLHLPKIVFIIVLLVNIGTGIGAIRSHISWLKALDEMQRKIQLESMAFALGGLWVAFGALLILNTAGIIHTDIIIFPVLAAVAMFAGTVFGVLKLR